MIVAYWMFWSLKIIYIIPYSGFIRSFFFKDLIISQSTFEEGIATIPKGQLKESIFFFHVHLSPFHLPTVTYLVREESKKAQ